MKQEIDADYLLENKHAKHLYHNICSNIPIIDYHCHIKVDDIYNNKKYRNIYELWLEKDHYKWRLMRSQGISEKYITGDGDPKEKFKAWLETLEKSIGNPLYQWSHMEARYYFGINQPLLSKDVDELWTVMNLKLGKTGMTARDFLNQAQVEVIGTTDQPLSDLHYHEMIQQDSSIKVKVVPTLRMDQLIFLQDREFLEEIMQKEAISTLDAYIKFIESRILYFAQRGCKAIDLGIEYVEAISHKTNPHKTFQKLLFHREVSSIEHQELSNLLIIETLKLAFKYDWVYQLHIGATPSINRHLKHQLGTGKGYDGLLDQSSLALNLMDLLNEVNDDRQLPKMVIYNVDATKNHVIANVIASFQDNEMGIRGKLQHGPAWWFQDTLSGNRTQLIDRAEHGMLSNFIGMTTDSRSLMSYVRHDYFRRILCSVIGKWVEDGEVFDASMLEDIVRDICYCNAKEFFRF